MALPELTAAASIINRSQRLILLTPERASLDAVSAMIAAYITLTDTKEVDEVSPRHVPLALQFLPGSSQMKMTPREQVDVVIDIAGPTQVAAMRDEPLQGGLRMHLVLPEGVHVTKDQIEVVVRPLPYDVAIIFGAADLEALGSLYSTHTDFFYNTPIINIDHRADNEHFGTVNLVDITAGSVAEVTYELIKTLASDAITPDIATALYAGIVAGTDSFQKPSTTPRSFQVAATLMEQKADREAVIQHLVKTKPLSLIKFVGRLYARLRYDEGGLFFWSVVRPIDFQESGARELDISSAMSELANNIAGFNAAWLLQESGNGRYQVYLLLGKGLRQQRDKIQTTLSATRDNGLLSFGITATALAEAEDSVLTTIRDIVR